MRCARMASKGMASSSIGRRRRWRRSTRPRTTSSRRRSRRSLVRRICPAAACGVLPALTGVFCQCDQGCRCRTSSGSTRRRTPASKAPPDCRPARCCSCRQQRRQPGRAPPRLRPRTGRSRTCRCSRTTTWRTWRSRCCWKRRTRSLRAPASPSSVSSARTP